MKLKLSEIIKAIEDGRTVKTDCHDFYDAEYFKQDKHHCISNIINDIACGRSFEIIEPNKVVEVWGHIYKQDGYPSWRFSFKKNADTHKITFEVDKDNKPICETIKMIEL